MRTQIVCCVAECDQKKPLKSQTTSLYSCVDEMDADLGCGLVRPLNAIIALKPMAALMRSAGDRVVVRVEKDEIVWGVYALSDVL